MRPLPVITFLIAFMVAMDLYAARGVQYLLFPDHHGNVVFYLIYWGITLLMLALMLIFGSRFQQLRDPSLFFGTMLVIGIFLMIYLPKLLFNATQLMGDLASLVYGLFSPGAVNLKKWFLIPGAAISILTFAAFGMGMARGRTHLKVFSENIRIRSLPEAFHGLRIVQLSDLHLAGFYNQPGYVRRVVSMANALEPDLLLFTGDMVHNFSEETDPFTGILKQLKAPLGKYAILGNHDYGFYYRWDSEAAKEANLKRVKSQIRACGFDLLLNEHRTISLNGDSIEIIGVENWGKPPFPQRGDLSKAMDGINPEHIKILMSHDPSHWDLQVRHREDIDLTLAGHTHGMQFGIEIGNFRWSPSKWTYKQWAGLYSENGQYLYVNRGLGFTGFPGRVGIRPEITLLTLQPL